jgi:hypothetical protein
MAAVAAVAAVAEEAEPPPKPLLAATVKPSEWARETV